MTEQTAPPFGQPGVVILPPGAIQESIRRQVDAVVGKMLPDTNGAIVGILTERGVNAAFIYRNDSGHLEAKAYVGKHWHGPVEGGITIQAMW